MDAFGNMVVAYQKFTGGTITIQAKRLGVSGLVGPEISIRKTPTFLSFDPAVAMNRFTGSFVVAYSQDSQKRESHQDRGRRGLRRRQHGGSEANPLRRE